MPHHRLPLPLLLAFLLAASSHGAPSGDDSYNRSLCLWRPSTCGGVSINYPFYLYDNTAVLRGNGGSYCGYPGLGMIICEDGKAVLQLSGDNYTITDINYNNFTVSLVYQEVFDDESCPIVDHNTTLPAPDVSWSWLGLPDETSVGYLFFFLNCNFTVVYQEPKTITPILCSSFDEGHGRSYVLPQDDGPDINWQKACKKITVPVLKDSLRNWTWNDPQNRNAWSSDDGYRSALRAGFQLVWERERRERSPCSQCEQSNGQCGYNQTGDFVGCLCSNGRISAGNICSSGHKKGTKIYIIVSTSCLLLLCLLVMAFFLAWKYGLLPIKSKEEPRIVSFLQKYGNLHPKRYTYAEVKRMTKSFSVKLGQGGFGAVYRGNIRDGCEASISRTSHVNVVTLLGFCLEGSKRALIYEYMPKGSLERYAFNRNFDSENTLTWEKLFEIAIGIARGLEYLHRGCNTRIVHFDIKPHNILLDQDFCPKISDFGLAKLCLNKESTISIGSGRGTIGYIAPEVYSKQFGTVSSKSDVHSYGMMVLEMVGARDTNNNGKSESSSQYFPQWIYEHLDDYCISASAINGETTELVRKLIVVGLWCIQLNPTHRPTMTRVVEMLEGSTSTLEVPPNMFFT